MKRQRWIYLHYDKSWEWVIRSAETRLEQWPETEFIAATRLSVRVLQPLEDMYERGLDGV